MSIELAQRDATGQAERVRRRDVKPLELVESAIERLERLNPRLNAVVHQRLERALADARAADWPDDVPFPGVPTLMKDIGGEEAGEPCCMGMRLLRRYRRASPHDGYLTSKLATAGLVSLGPDSGERRRGLSCEFMLPRSVRDAARLLDCVAGPMPGDPYSAPLPRVTFAEPLRAYARRGMTGQPAISLPVHHTEAGLPIGAQLVAATGREDLLLAVAAQVEQATPWASRRPEMFG